MSNYTLGPLELGTWRGLLRVHAALIKELDAELQAAHGLPLSSYEVLLTLRHSPAGEMRMSQIADSVLLSRSGLTRLVDRLERDGLIERRECAADKRGAYAALTETGRERFDEAQRTHLSGVRARFLERLGEEDMRRLTAVWEQLLPGAAGTP